MSYAAIAFGIASEIDIDDTRKKVIKIAKNIVLFLVICIKILYFKISIERKQNLTEIYDFTQ